MLVRFVGSVGMLMAKSGKHSERGIDRGVSYADSFFFFFFFLQNTYV